MQEKDFQELIEAEHGRESPTVVRMQAVDFAARVDAAKLGGVTL